MTSMTSDQQTELELRRHSQLQSLLINLSNRFINIPLQALDLAIDDALCAVGQFINADRAYLYEYDFQRQTIAINHEWRAEGAPSSRQMFVSVKWDDIPDWVDSHWRGDIINLPQVSNLSDQSVRDLLDRHSVCSLIALPLKSGGRCLGFIGFDTIDREQVWSDNQVALLEMLAQLLVNASLRADREQELIQAREQQQEANRQLEEALDRVQIMAMEAEAADIAKSQFLAGMSHEIRTPMNAIVGLTHLAMEKNRDRSIESYLHKIQHASSTLLQTINDILDYSKIEAGRMQLSNEPFSLESVIEAITGMFSFQAHERDLALNSTIDPEVPDRLFGDPLRLRQILINLVGNALKFTDQGEVSISATLEELTEDSATLRFAVKDTGIGIPPDKRKVLFRPFSQVDPALNRKYHGTGLGLSITKRLVDLMDGEIGLKSEPGNGSEFFFTIPFKIQIDAGIMASLINRQGLKVLIVDDDPGAREILSEAMKSFHFKHTCASSGRQALQILEETTEPGVQPYDLILLDYKMKGLDGFETARRIKQNRKLKKTPVIIMVTAYQSDQAKKQAKEMQLDGFLVKPVSQSTLFDPIVDIFGREESLFSASVGDELQQSAATTPAGASVLIVEDNPTNQEIARELLHQAGFRTTTAENGEQALEVLRKQSFDAVLMDVQMPIMDGYETTKRIRRSRRIDKDVPIIAITAHAMSGDREQALQAGMNDYIAKPFDPQQLIAKVRQWIADPKSDRKAPTPATSKATLQNAFPPIKGIDTEDGLRRVGDNPEVYLRLLRQFMEECEKAARELTPCSGGRENCKHTSSVIHNLKGVAGNIGAKSLMKLCQEAETKLSANRSIRRELQKIVSQAQRLRREIARHLPDQAPAPEASLQGEENLERARELLANLRELLENDLHVEQKILDNLAEVLPRDNRQATELMRAVTDFDYAKAQSICDCLMTSCQTPGTRRSKGVKS